MVPGLGELSPMNLSGAADARSTESKPLSEPSVKTKEFESVMSKQLKERQPVDRRKVNPGKTEESRKSRNKDNFELEEAITDDSPETAEQATEQKMRVEAMIEFMVSIEGELGIEPEQMIQAMRSVQEEGDTLTQEQAIAKTLSLVEIESDQVDRAAELYALYKVSAEHGGNFLTEKGAVPVSDMNFNVLTKEQLRKNELTSNVNSMQSVFFETGEVTREDVQLQAGTQARRNPIEVPDLMNLQPTPEDEIGVATETEVDVEEGLLDKNGKIQQTSSRTKSDSMDEMLNQMRKPNAQELSSKMVNQLVSKQVLSQQQVQAASLQGDAASATEMSDIGSLVQGFSADTSGDSPAGDMTGDQFGLANDHESSEVDEGFAEDSEAFIIPTLDNGRAKSVKAAIAPAQADPVVDVENAQDMVDQARVLIRRGGGEMKVRLNPDGLGQVELKVDVKNGVVNIQMVADHSEAKKALEKGIGDLKSNLALHLLNVESVKVEVAGEISKHLENAEKEENFSREFARDFMGKMRDGGQSSRDDFESSSQQYYGQQREGVEPVQLAASDVAQKNQVENRRLHVVA